MDINRIVKVHKTVERFWLIILSISICITGYWWYTGELADHKFAPILPVIAFVWYMVRRFMRKRLERQIENGEFEQPES